MSKTNEYEVTLAREIDGADFGKWKTISGGGADSAETTVRDGYGLPRKQLGAPAVTDPITVSRVFYPDTDGGQLAALKAGVGSTRFIGVKQKLSIDGHATGKPETFNCMLKSCKPADVDTGDDSPSADIYTVELSVEGP